MIILNKPVGLYQILYFPYNLSKKNSYRLVLTNNESKVSREYGLLNSTRYPGYLELILSIPEVNNFPEGEWTYSIEGGSREGYDRGLLSVRTRIDQKTVVEGRDDTIKYYTE